MARLTAEFKRGILRTLYRQVTSGAQSLPGGGDSVGGGAQTMTLALALNAFQDGGFASVQNGRLVIGTQGGGRAVTFMTPAIWQTMTPEEMFSVAEELQALYSDACTTLGIQPPTDTTQDASIFNTMMASLPTITSVQKDYTTMRWPSRL